MARNKKVAIIVSLVLILLLVGLLFFNGFSNVGNVIIQNSINMEKPLLIVSNVYLKEEFSEGRCNYVLEGEISNLGRVSSTETVIRCVPVFYSPYFDGLGRISIYPGDVVAGSEIIFSKELELKCDSPARFDCFAECDNC